MPAVSLFLFAKKLASRAVSSNIFRKDFNCFTWCVGPSLYNTTSSSADKTVLSSNNIRAIVFLFCCVSAKKKKKSSYKSVKHLLSVGGFFPM